MSRPIPVLDPNGSRSERTGFIRTESIALPLSSRSRQAEGPGFTLWAGPKALVINADLPGIDLDNLQIDIIGARLVFRGTLQSLPPGGDMGRSKGRPSRFSHVVELPYRVDADRAEVQKGSGLVSIVLKKEQSASGNGQDRLESSIRSSVRRYFGENGASSDRRKEDTVILQTLDRYFEFIRGNGAAA